MTAMYGFETADSRETKLRFVSIVFLERLIVLRAAVPEFPIGPAAAAPCLGALNRGIWRNQRNPRKSKENHVLGSLPAKEILWKSPKILPKPLGSPENLENPRGFSEILGKSRLGRRRRLRNLRNLQNSPGPQKTIPERFF